MNKIYTVLWLLLCQQLLFAQGDMAMNVLSNPHLAQENLSENTLSGILGQIEKKFKVFFNFDPDLISNKDIDGKIIISDDLNETLERVLKPLGLEYQKLGDSYYAIYPVKERAVKEKMQPVENLPVKESGENDVGDNGSRGFVSPKIFHRTDLSKLLKQESTITGRVTDSDGEALIGVNVLVKGTNKGTSTDFEGNFTLEDVNENAVLVVSYIGYQTQEIPVNGEKEITITLLEDLQTLDEVVVVGYGTQKKSDLTGSISSIPKDRLEISPNINISQAIQGAVSGVMIQTSSAGAAPTESLMIRGRNSINAGNTPLVVVDGISYYGNISDINPADVESIEILKDASASAIYGARGANGVILITTKKGRDGDPIVSYNSHISFQRFTKLPNVMNGEEFFRFREERFPGVVTESEREVLENEESVDWINLGLREGFRQQHNLSLAGAIGKTSFYLSGGYLGANGIVINDDFQRMTGRLNLDIPLNDWLTIGTRTQLSNDNKSGVPPSQSSLFYMNPNSKPYDDEGNLTIYPWPEDVFFGNPLAPTLYDDINKSDQVLSNNYVLIKLPFLKGLSYRLNGGVRNRTYEQSTYRGRNTASGLESRGNADLSRGSFFSSVYENILSYNSTIRQHGIFATAVLGYERNKNTSNSLSAVGFPNDFLSFYAAPQADASIPSFSFTETKLLSQMLRLNYIYDSRYLVTLTGRRDGFSGFGEATKWGVFPSIAIAWNLANEGFFPFRNIFNSIKLRASYGSNGNNAIGAYESLSNLSSNDFIHQSETRAGFFPAKLGQENLSWEESKTLNIGLDFGLMENRIYGEVNFFSTNTSDLLLNRTISSVHGITSIIQNIGEVENIGFEFSINSRNVTRGNFTWNTSGNISIIRNKIVDLYGTGTDDIANSWFIGHPINVNFDFVVDGVWQLNEADQAATWGSQPGFVKLRDVNGDGRMTASEDMQIIGQRDPKLMWGMTNIFSFKKFSLNIFIHGVHGVTKRNPLKTDNDTYAQVRQNTTKKNWWTPNNPTNDFVMNHLDAEIMDGIGGRGGSRIWWYENASFIRVKDVSISYNAPENFIKRIGLQGFRIYINGRNQFTFTEWDALDPELSSQLAIPLQKELVFGLDLKF
ncbi:SusC/RagA family TonB-linked outer membrane protein [Membranihabitans maritimus]|uniref:SusC/RagA family TonB-linked outer membrane protein n=1 Tax=Membranihabitans maritimus TaxID=2904244 RepID=UPI001F405C24|nr:TonB-dependent receptor [Membranihabitans maritimus]